MTSPNTSKRPIGVIGLGLMGTPIADHLLAAGHPVVGFDVDRGKCAEAAGRGVVIVDSVGDLSREVDIVVTVLPSASAFNAVIDELWVDRDRSANTDTPIVVDVSTLAEATKQAAATRSAARGISLLDCPVVGTSAQAHAGQLVMCASGSPQEYATVEPVVKTFVRRVVYLGEFGVGGRMKLVANLLVSVHNAAAAEALTLAEKVGIDPALAIEVLSGTGASSGQLELRGPLMASREYAPATALVTMLVKDTALIAELAREAVCPTPLLHAATNLYIAANAMGKGADDVSSIHSITALVAGATPTTSALGK